MCVVSRGYGVLGGGRAAVVNGMHASLGQGGWSHVERCRSIYRVRGDTLVTPDHTLSRCVALRSGEPELVGLPRKALAQDATRRFRLVVHAAGWLHSMVLHGCCCRGTVIIKVLPCLE